MKSDGTGHIWRRGAWIGVGFWFVVSEFRVYPCTAVATVWMMSDCLWVVDQFFTTNPLPCDPSSLPKYPPSKELNAKMRDEEAGR
ncbi:hypothetical protein Dimus_022524 [Dionaea muscipula]